MVQIDEIEKAKALAIAQAQALASQRKGGTAGHYAFDEQKARPNTYGQSWFSQLTSGANEGLANTLGAPVDIANAGIGLGMKGINALAGTDMQPSASPFGGSEFFKQSMGPAIQPTTDDPYQQFGRRMAQSTGAAVVPGLGAAASAAKPLQMAANVMLPAAAGGAAAATSQQMLPNNPTAEMMAELVGSLGTAGATAALRKGMTDMATRAAVPDIDKLRANKTAGYKAVDDAGITYSPQQLDELIAGISDEMSAGHLNPVRHPKAASMLDDIKAKTVTGESPSLTGVDQLRQVVRRDVANAPDEAEQFFGGKMIANIDEFLNASEGGPVVNAARDANKRYRNYQRVADASTKAERRTAVTGSGGNINNATRQKIEQIRSNPKLSKFYSQEELAKMDEIIMGSRAQNLGRQVGKLSPGGNGLQQALALGATAYNPLMAAVPATGMIAKGLADRSTRKGIKDLLAQIATGGPLPKAKLMDEKTRRALTALLASSTATAEAK